MAIEQAVYGELIKSESLDRVLNGRIFPIRIPQKTKLPAAVYYRVSGVPYNNMGAFGLSRVRIRFDIWAFSYSEVKDIADILKMEIAAAKGFEKMIENCGPDWGDDKTFRTSLDIICWERGGYCYE